MLGPSAHVDSFARDNLPPADLWPVLKLDGFDYPEHLNAAVELTDRMVGRGFGDHIALIGNGRVRTYKLTGIHQSADLDISSVSHKPIY